MAAEHDPDAVFPLRSRPPSLWDGVHGAVSSSETEPSSRAAGKRPAVEPPTTDQQIAKAMRKEAPVKEGKKTNPEDRMSQFTEALIGKEHAPGILRERARADGGKVGRANMPYPHQRKFVKRMVNGDKRRLMMVHAPGTGKTFTFLLHVAARHITRRGKRQKVLISVPTSCLQQWNNAVLDTLDISPKRILVTNRASKLTKESIAKHDILIVTKETVGRAFSSCHEWVQAHHRNERNHWVSQWDRKPGVPLHPLFAAEYTLVGIDELHCTPLPALVPPCQSTFSGLTNPVRVAVMRNCLTGWTKGHELVSKAAEEVIGLAATPVFNKPDDMMGLATAMDLPNEWKTWNRWFKDRKRQYVNTESITEFNQTFVDAVSDDILNLPPITHETENFEVNVDPEHVADYNDILARAQRLRCSIERNGNRASAQEMNKLMSYLQTMQQFLVSPLLARTGAGELQKDQDLIRQASMDDTGALIALRNTLLGLNEKGLNRVMVAACHTSLLKIAMEYLKRTCPEVGDIILYTGELRQKQRASAIERFLGGSRTVMLMSIDAGGTGLHLVPGSNAVVFWGSRPFSPMQVLQTAKRVHRIGQEHPVIVNHLIAAGSVDFAINMVHGDKLSVSKAIVDDDLSSLESQGGRWRSTGRIVDACRFLSETGTFLDEDPPANHAAGLGAHGHHSGGVGSSSSPDALYGDDASAAGAPVINPGSVDDLMMDLPPLPPSIAQALMANAALLSTDALLASGLVI